MGIWRWILWVLLGFLAGSSSLDSPHLDSRDRTPRAHRPHILFLLADDYGWNDVGYHGSEIRTPTLDRLSANGVRLENHIVCPMCTPTRGSLLTGRYTIHTGFQNNVAEPGKPKALPSHLPTLAERLLELGYATHMVGKWHVGYTTWHDTPTGRGFQSHMDALSLINAPSSAANTNTLSVLWGIINTIKQIIYTRELSKWPKSVRWQGPYQGVLDYYNHTNCDGPNDTSVCGYDFFRDQQEDWSAFGHYATDLYKDRVAEILSNHDPDQPLFLYVAFQLPHSPMQVPNKYYEDYRFIKDPIRRIYAGMVSYMDQTVADIQTMFEKHGMWEDTLLIFSSDNGGSTKWGGRNDPLRGGKGDHWQGGVQAVSFVHGYNIDIPATTVTDLLHITDWFPTLIHLAGGSTDDLDLDGYDIWDTLSKGSPSARSEVLVNISPLAPPLGRQYYNGTFDARVKAAIISGKWKLMTGHIEAATISPGYIWNNIPREKYNPVRLSGQCHRDMCFGLCENVWLVDLSKDPNEEMNLACTNPHIVHHLLDRLAYYNASAVPPQNPSFDPRSFPNLHNGVWAPWL